MILIFEDDNVEKDDEFLIIVRLELLLIYHVIEWLIEWLNMIEWFEVLSLFS